MNIVNRIPERIVPVGRLDYDTEGLLILTNDGDFSQLLQHPRFQIERCYRVKVKGAPPPAVIEKLKAGVYIDNVKTNKCKIKLLDRLDKNTWLEMRLKEGRNRQIRKMFELVGHDAIRIIRTEFGTLELGALPVGAFRFLNKKEIEEIKALEKTLPVKPPRKTFLKPRRKPVGESSGKPFGWAVGKPVERTTRKPSGRAAGNPAARSFAKAGAKPAGRSAEKPFGKPAARSFGKAGAKPAERPAEKPFGKFAARSFGTTGAKPAGRPAEKPFGKPAARSFGKPVGKTSAKPARRLTGKPAGRPRRTP